MNPDTVTDPVKQQANAATVRNLYRGFRRAMDTLPAASQPLVVFSAGNLNMDARWNAARIATDSASANGWAVLVVGGNNRADGYYTRTNTGNVVRVSAPAEDVHVIGGNGAITSGEGTSYAAPMAAGLAGQLFSFVPSLTALQVRDLIIDGAVRGGRRVGGSGPPIINARESLILSGRRPGAPLCGNRLWMLNGTMYAQRDTAATVGEPIFSVGGSPSPYGFNALHGGKRVHVSGGGGNHMMQWAAGTWSSGPLPGSGLPAGSNASYLSRLPASHDGDSTLSVRSTRTAGTVEFRFRLSTGAGTQTLPGMITAPYDDGTPLCIREFVSVPSAEADALSNSPSTDVRTAYQDFLQRVQANPCLTPGDPDGFRHSTARAAWSPRGDVAYIFVTQRVGTTAVGGWATCQTRELISHGNYRYELPLNTSCRGTTTTAVSAGTMIYRLSLAGGGISGPVGWGEPQAELMNAAIREDGKELVADRRMLTTETNVAWLPGAAFPKRTDRPQVLTCALQYRAVSTGSSALGVNNGCRQTLGEGGFAASRESDTR